MMQRSPTDADFKIFRNNLQSSPPSLSGVKSSKARKWDQGVGRGQAGRQVR